MKKQYKIQLPKGKKVTMTNVDFENGVMTVNVELENRTNFHEAIHNEVCGVFGKINNELEEVLKANGVTREKIEEMAKESIKELEKDCPDIWDKIIQGYIEAISGKKGHEYEPKEGDFISFDDYYGLNIAIYNVKYAIGHKLYCFYNEKKGLYYKGGNVTTFDFTCRPSTEEEKNLLIDKLAEIGKRWNEETRTIEDVKWRAGKSEPYYYIIGFDSIVGTTDERLACDENRYATNNYFKNREAAEKVAEQIREIFKSSKAK